MDKNEEVKKLRADFDNELLRTYNLKKSVDKKMRDSVFTTKKELDEQAYRNYVRGGYLARKLEKLSENEDENEEEIEKLYESQSALSLKEDNLRELTNKFFNQYEELSKIKDETEKSLVEGMRFRDEKISELLNQRYLPRIRDYTMKDVEKLVRELRSNKK